jgi:peptide-methionine (S)-S-oxide reductase
MPASSSQVEEVSLSAMAHWWLPVGHITGTRCGGEMSENTETAILAGGCFWPAQELLRRRDGVISTRVGYTGGENDHPTADNHPGHAEAVEVIFDPERASYRDILEFFFQIHRPDLGQELVGSDYRSEIFYTSDEQRQVAEGTIADIDASGLWPGKVVTRISKARPFWEAEAEDQDYLQDYPEGKNQLRPCGPGGPAPQRGPYSQHDNAYPEVPNLRQPAYPRHARDAFAPGAWRTAHAVDDP